MFGLTPGEILDFIGLLVVGLLTFSGGWIGHRVLRGNGREANAVSFANTLATRLDRVEARVEHLETELTLAQKLVQAATQYIDKLLWWHRTKRITPMPRPPKILTDHLDPEVLVEDGSTPHPKGAPDEATP